MGWSGGNVLAEDFMSAKYEVEAMMTGALKALESELGVPVLAGRRTGERPGSFVVVRAEEERFATPTARAGFVEVDVVSVAQLDNAGEVEASKRRIGQIGLYFGTADVMDDMREAGTPEMRTWPSFHVMRGSSVLVKDRSQGDVLRISVGVQRM
jgi:hypothetical protein